MLAPETGREHAQPADAGRPRSRPHGSRRLAWWERPLPIAIGALVAALGGWLLGAGSPDPTSPSMEPVATAGFTLPGAASTETAPTEATSNEAVPAETVPTEGASTEAVPSDAVPTEAAATEAASNGAGMVEPGVVGAAVAEVLVDGITGSGNGASVVGTTRLESFMSGPPSIGPPSVGSVGSITLDTPLDEMIILENRALAAEVAALERETTELQREMLDLDLQLAALDGASSGVYEGDGSGADSGADGGGRSEAGAGAAIDTGWMRPFDRAGDAGRTGDVMETDRGETSAAPPIELGNTTLVPPPLPLSDVGAAASVTLADMMSGSGSPGADALDSAEPFLPRANIGESYELSELSEPSGSVDAGRPPASPNTSLPVERLVISDIEPDSAAEAAGLEPGDVLLEIDGLPVLEFEDVVVHDIGNPAPLHEVEVLRDAERRRVALTDTPAMLMLEVRWIDSARLVR